jgi:hypothetical protein
VSEILQAALAGYQIQLAAVETRIAEIRRRLRLPQEGRRRPRTHQPENPSVRRGRWPGGQRPWAAEELDRLSQLYPIHRQKNVAEILGRTRTSVASKAKQLGLGRRRYFTPAELDRIRELYADHPTEEIAEQLGRTELSVYQSARKLGLKKSEAYLKTVGFQRGSQVGAAFRFPKGHAPANKGVRRPGWAPGRMGETQFKKGQRPHTWKPIGTIMADSEGFLRIKVRERNPDDPERGWHPDIWPLLHRRTWEQHNGPIPVGHHVAFKDRNRQNCAIENLELVSQAEMAERNRMWNNYPRELAELIQLNGVLKRKLRRFNRGNEK